MPLVVRAFPILEGMEREVRRFAKELSGPRRQEAAVFYRSFGVRRESWYLQQTPQGPLVISVTEIDEPEVQAPQYAQSTRQFDLWYKDQVRRLSGVDPEIEPLGPPTEALFEFHEDPEDPLDSTRAH